MLNPVAYNFRDEEQEKTTPSAVDTYAHAAAMAEFYGNAVKTRSSFAHDEPTEPTPSEDSGLWADTRANVRRGSTIMIGDRRAAPRDVTFNAAGTIGTPVCSGTAHRNVGNWLTAEHHGGFDTYVAIGPQIDLEDYPQFAIGPQITLEEYPLSAIPGSYVIYTGFTDAPERKPTATEYLSLLRNTKLEHFIEPIVERIRFLAELASEEGDDQKGIRQESMSAFLKFLYIHRNRILNQPSIVLTTEGNLRAEWRRHSADRVAIEFINEDRVMFVSFLPDSKNPTQTNRVSGAAGLKSFFESTSVRDL